MCKYPSPFSSKQWRCRSDGHDACHLRVMLPVTICFSYIVLIIRMMDNMGDFQVATCLHTPGTHTCMATKVLNLGSLKGCCSFHPMSQWCSLVATVHNCLILLKMQPHLCKSMRKMWTKILCLQLKPPKERGEEQQFQPRRRCKPCQVMAGDKLWPNYKPKKGMSCG